LIDCAALLDAPQSEGVDQYYGWCCPFQKFAGLAQPAGCMHQNPVVMGIASESTISMLNIHEPAIATGIPACFDYNTGLQRQSAFQSAAMSIPLHASPAPTVAGSQGTLGGPNKTLKLAAVSKGLGRGIHCR